jgi:hypothetical protein
MNPAGHNVKVLDSGQLIKALSKGFYDLVFSGATALRRH